MSDMRMNYNPSPAVRRLMMEAKELNEPTEEYCAYPLEDNIFEWHFTIRGASDSVFASGLYHGRIILPTDYPYKPPSIIFLTPNGRFKINQKICLSISGYHPETWLPSWSIRTALLALIQFMTTPGDGHIGAINYPEKERRYLAKKSLKWECDHCGPIENKLKPRTIIYSNNNNNSKTNDDNNNTNQINLNEIKTDSQIPESSESNIAQESNGSDHPMESSSVSASVSSNNQNENGDLEQNLEQNPLNDNETEQQQQEQEEEHQREEEPEPAAESYVTIILYSILILIICYILRRLDLSYPKQS